MDNSCEVTFVSNENLILSPCGSEFIYRTYENDNTVKSKFQLNSIQLVCEKAVNHFYLKGTFKYRTAYPISAFSSKLNVILSARNRYCNDRPFISPILIETSNKECWLSADKLKEVTWHTTQMSMNLKNPIQVDYHNFFFVWKSDCKNVEFKLSFNKCTVLVKYPLRVPKSSNDEFEHKLEHFKKQTLSTNSKHLFKYTWNEEEFSANHIPLVWEELYKKMLLLIENKQTTSLNNEEASNVAKQEIKVLLPEAMDLSCKMTHLHKFENIETLSEPKVIYVNQSWFKQDTRFFLDLFQCWPTCVGLGLFWSGLPGLARASPVGPQANTNLFICQSDFEILISVKVTG